MSRKSNPSAHALVASRLSVSPVPSSLGFSVKRKNPFSLHDDRAAPVHAVAKKAKSVDEIDQEVRDLLDKKLFGKDDAAKVEAMRRLHRYFQKGETSAQESRRQGYRHAVAKRNGCQLVLIVLQQELDADGDAANRDFVVEALTFLQLWNYRGAERRDAMLRFNGVDVIKRAMRTFPGDPLIQYGAIATLMNYTSGDDKKYREELVKARCIPLLVRTMVDPANSESMRNFALIILGCLCAVAGPDCFEGHVHPTAFGAVLDLFQAAKNSNEDVAQEVRDSCRVLARKMLE
jgi:hypothetical protein